MLVLSVGMVKSGSGWFFNLTNDLLVAAGNEDVRTIRKKYGLGSILKHYNCNIGTLTPDKLKMLTSPPLTENTFVAKTHGAPIKVLNDLISLGSIKLTYIFRDPRDVALSAYEHGKYIRSQGNSHTFANLKSIKQAILWTESNCLSTWKNWKNVKEVLLLRYEDLLTNTLNELNRLRQFLKLEVNDEVMINIIAKYEAEQLNPNLRNYLHFNKGIIGRYSEIMNSDELILCEKSFGKYLTQMGYPKINN